MGSSLANSIQTGSRGKCPKLRNKPSLNFTLAEMLLAKKVKNLPST